MRRKGAVAADDVASGAAGAGSKVQPPGSWELGLELEEADTAQLDLTVLGGQAIAPGMLSLMQAGLDHRSRWDDCESCIRFVSHAFCGAWCVTIGGG